MAAGNQRSLREIAKAIGVSHSTLSKIQNGSYEANPQRIIKKLLDYVLALPGEDGVAIPSSKYSDIIDMLGEARFEQFGKTSRTATWLFEKITNAQKGVD